MNVIEYTCPKCGKTILIDKAIFDKVYKGKECLDCRAKVAELQKEIDKITIIRPIKNIQNNIKTIKKI